MKSGDKIAWIFFFFGLALFGTSIIFMIFTTKGNEEFLIPSYALFASSCFCILEWFIFWNGDKTVISNSVEKEDLI